MLHAAKALSLSILILVAACSEKPNPCEDKLVVLEGNGVIEVVSQWDACVAHSASQFRGNGSSDQRLAALALEACQNHAGRYAAAILEQTPTMSESEVMRVVQAYRSNLSRIAVSELHRARKLGCEAK